MNIVSYICVSLLCIFIHECWASPPPDYKSRNFDSSYENSTTNNIKSQRLENEWEYVDLAFKIDYTALNGPGQHLLNGVFLGHTIARETFATQFILDVHRAVNVSTDRLYVHNVTPATHHYEHAARYVMVSFRMYSVSNTTEEFKFSASGGSRGYGKSRNPAYSRGGGYSEDPERFNDIGSADSTPNMGYQGDLSTVEALAELSDQAQNKDSELIRMGNVTRAVDPQWGLVALDWDVSIKLAYTVGVIDGSIPKSEAYVSDPSTNRFAGGGGSGNGAATGEVEAFSDVLWLNQGADRYCLQEEGASLSYSQRSSERSAYCEFEYYFRNDIATALNVTTSRVLLLLIKSASRDHSLVYFRLLPPADGNETSTAFLIADLQDQVLNLDSSLYNGNVTVRTDSSWGVSGYGGRERKRSPYLPYAVCPTSFAHTSGYERCKATQRCPRAKEVYNVSDGSKRISYQAFDGGRHFELSSKAHLFDDPGWAELKGDPTAMLARQEELERAASLYREVTGGKLGGSGGRAGLFADFEDPRVGTHGWRQRGGPPPISDKRPPHGAHFSPFQFDTLGPSIPIPSPYGRKSGQGSGASRQSDDGSVTNLHIEYAQQDLDYFQNRGLVINNQTFAKQLETQREVLDILKSDLEWHVLNRKSALMDAELRSRQDVERFMSKRIDLISRRIEAEEKQFHKLSNSQCALNHPISNRLDGCRIIFNTSAVSLEGLTNETIFGVVAETSEGTPVAVFTFDSIELGPEVNVTLVGQRALVLLSRSSVLINTTFQALPGTLGGFPGGYSWGRRPEDILSDEPADAMLRHLPSMQLIERPGFMDDDDQRLYRSGFSSSGGGGYDSYSHDSSQHEDSSNMTTASNNVNGPGSGNVRNYQYTVTTTALDVDEVQVITTSSNQGQQLDGTFTLKYLNFITQRIPWDASASLVKSVIESDLNPAPLNELSNLNRMPNTNTVTMSDARGVGSEFVSGVGTVSVSRDHVQDDGGYSWSVTFITATGDIPEMTAQSYLDGIGSQVLVETVQEGNSLSGYFQLSMFGLRSEPIPHDASAQEFKESLEKGLYPTLLRAHVWRSDSTSIVSRDACRNSNECALPFNSKCNDGHCQHGPTPGGGFTWSLLLTTLEGNVSPTSPANQDSWKQAKRDNLINFGFLKGAGAQVSIEEGHYLSNLEHLKKFSVVEPFSLAYGGGGAGFGGDGGVGFNGSVPTGEATRRGRKYGDAFMSDLYGGSGGQMGYVSPQDVATFTTPTGRGGAGGGAIEIVAVNDLIVGSYGGISVNGDKGTDGHVGGGGGGSGGSILLVAGGALHLEGGARLEAKGGDGGRTGGQRARSSQTYQRTYGGEDTEFIASSFSSTDGGAVPAALTAKQERMLANLAKTTKGKGKPNSGVSARHIASMRASMLRGVSFTDAHKLALSEEDTAQDKAEIKTAIVERAGGGGGGGRIAVYAHAVSLATQRALFKRDREFGPIERTSLLNGGGITGSIGGKNINDFSFGDTGDAYGNGGDGGERLDSSWRLHDGSRGSGNNQPGRPFSNPTSDGSPRGTGTGHGGYAVYDMRGGRCVTRQKSVGPQNGTLFQALNSTNNTSIYENGTEFEGSIVYLGPNETAYLCSRERQGGRGTFHIEIDVGVAVQVVERGVDDYADKNNNSSAGVDFDRFAGGNGGAQGTSRSLRLDSASAERVVSASGVMQRRPYPFQGVEHDILGALPSSIAMKLSHEMALEKRSLANELKAYAEKMVNSSTSTYENRSQALLAAEEAEEAAILAQKVSQDTYRGSHRPSRISFYVKINGSDFVNDRSDGGFTAAQPAKRKQGSWGALIALHSADYGRRSGYNRRGGNDNSTSSSSFDPYEAAGYFKHNTPGVAYQNILGSKRRGGLGATGFSTSHNSQSNLSNETTTLNNSTNTSRVRHVDTEVIPRVLMGISIGENMRHGTDFLVTPNELVSPIEPEEINPLGSAHRRTANGAMHESVVGDGLDALPVFSSHTQQHRWYKVDIFLDWDRRIYNIRVDDERMVTAPFSVEHDQVLRLGVYTINSATVWIDEIYVGPDLSRQFETPFVTGTGADMARPRQTNGWTGDDIGGVTTNHEMTRHESHLSRRKVYSFDKTFAKDHNESASSNNLNSNSTRGVPKLIPFDGDGHRKFHSDVHERRPRGFMHHTESVSDVEGDYGHGGDGGGLPSNIHAGALLFVKGHRTGTSVLNRAATSYTNDQSTSGDGKLPEEVGQSWSSSRRDRETGYKGYMDGATDLKEPRNIHQGSTGRYYWYGEHFKAPSGEAADGSGVGGIYCMSSSDLVNWRNEGLMLDFRNLTDMVNGVPPRGAKLVADRPKVIFNNLTQLYVMYMHLEYAHDTDPTEDNSNGGYSRIVSEGNETSGAGSGYSFQQTRINTKQDGNTLSANSDMVGGARYPSSNSEWALLKQKEAHRLGQLDSYAGLTDSQLNQRFYGTDGGLIESASTVGTSPDGYGVSILATTNHEGTGQMRHTIPVHSDRGVDGLGSGVGEGSDVERGHYQEHNWIRRESLVGNWSGSQLGMAAIATSSWPNGPFLFRRSFYPDGNKTKDQTLFGQPAGEVSKKASLGKAARDRLERGVYDEETEEGGAFLGRTYYANVEYVMPKAVMQPIWESVKHEDGSINYALSYHRSFYESEYDKFHDIYLQRWRHEDKKWRVICVNRTDGSIREVPRESSGGWARKAASSTPDAVWELPSGAVCFQPDEYKVVVGQGWPAIRSRFLDPRDPKNNVWRPSSVPSVKAQDWWNNYRRGACGIRKLDDDLSPNDILLERGYPNISDSERRYCTDIADNPLHPTLSDILMGPLNVAETRRSKYVAFSSLTDDFMDTSGSLHSFEGELEDEKDMISLLTQFGNQFWHEKRKSRLASTFHPPITTESDEAGNMQMSPDYETRMHQYEMHPGDRSDYSLACVLDGTCSVNFRDQVQNPGYPEDLEEAGGKFDTLQGSPTTGSQDFRSSFTGRR